MSYIDIDLNLKLHPLSKDIVLLNNDLAIRTAIKNICLYGPYDNPYEFGTEYAGIYDSLFELETSRTTKTTIYTKLMSLIKEKEPRVIVNNVSTEIVNDNQFDITISYTIKSTSLPDTVKFSIIRTS